MDVQVCFCLLLAAFNVASAQSDNHYFKKGGTLELRPNPAPGSITNIEWKWETDIAASWGDVPEPEYYNKFRGRTNLDIKTGVMKITDMTSEDAGTYSVVINNKVQGRTYKAVEIMDVPKPEISAQPLACSKALEECSLICQGDTRTSGPVSYMWRKDGGQWEAGGRELKIQKNETLNIETFFCKMKNPVSESESAAYRNPFSREDGGSPGGGPSKAGIITGVIVVILLLAGVGAFLFIRSKKPKRLTKFCKIDKGETPRSENEIEVSSVNAPLKPVEEGGEAASNAGSQ
ncbi:CD48 antigen-like isoform 1-T1 [Pholidichthys leucotaenia]